MEVLVGPAFTIEDPSSPPASYDGEPPTNSDGDGESDVPRSFFEDGSGFWVGGKPVLFTGESSESSSSIGSPDDSDDENGDVLSKKEEDEEEEVQSKLKKGLGSLDSIQDSLPIKKGLSNHFAGKSKSFTDLSQVNHVKSVKELQKQENPFNKRRRILIASKWSRKSSFYTWSNPRSMPLLPVDEDSDEPEEAEEEEEEGGGGGEAGEEQKARKVSPSSSSSSEEVLLTKNNRVPLSYAAHMRQRLGSFKSRSFSLADLQEHDEEEEEEEEDCVD